jgi:hypothetical protein
MLLMMLLQVVAVNKFAAGFFAATTKPSGQTERRL